MKNNNLRLSNNHIENELISKLDISNDIFHEILKHCDNKFDFGTGSYLFDGTNYEYCDRMFEKQLLLFEKVKNVSSVLEIGTYMGHSILLMLLSNPNLKITCIDIEDTYSRPSINLLNDIFNAKISFIKGNSLDVLPSLNDKFDLFHIDGSHTIDFVSKEFELCKNLSTSNDMQVIFDDYDSIGSINSIIEENHTIIEQITPNCDWRNSYLKIKID